MKKKYLIVSGCSWADPEQYSEDPKVSNDIVKNYYIYLNRPHNADNNSYNLFGSSTITAMEVSA